MSLKDIVRDFLILPNCWSYSLKWNRILLFPVSGYLLGFGLCVYEIMWWTLGFVTIICVTDWLCTNYWEMVGESWCKPVIYNYSSPILELPHMWGISWVLDRTQSHENDVITWIMAAILYMSGGRYISCLAGLKGYSVDMFWFEF